ncbi:MAG: hypothetical protein ACK59G_13965, partial [Cyanobacteriota bacterium]
SKPTHKRLQHQPNSSSHPCFNRYAGFSPRLHRRLVAVHLVPATLVLSFMTRECWKGVGKQMPIIATLGLFILYPNFWGVTMLGYPDIAGLVPLGLAAILILRTEWLTQANRRESGVIGLLFWATFLLRRHFAYTI